MAKDKLHYDASGTTFKEAFAEARGDGKTTFEWNGTKYNTRLETPKSKAKAEEPSEPENKVEVEAPAAAVKQEPAAAKKEEKKYGIGPHGAFAGIHKAISEFKTPAEINSERRKSQSVARADSPKKMAKGGSASSRGDGIAQRGKTRGRII
jgi:hypothetical protein